MASPRVTRVLLALVIVAFVLPWIVVAATNLDGVTGLIGFDFSIYRDATSRWLDGGSFYLAHQLAGPYEIANGDVLYPPFGIYLFAPFLILPGVLWWAIPLGVTIAAVVRLRPSYLGVAAAIGCLLPPITIQEVLKGNPVIWVVAFESLALIGLPLGPWVLMKASLFPFALIGVRRRGWLLSVVALGLVTLPLAGLVGDWIKAVVNSNGGLAYSIKDVPLMLAPLAIWAGSKRRSGSLAAPRLASQRQ